jgi:predicted amidohydrolase
MFKAACIQNCAGLDLQRNIDETSALIRQARTAGADLICLPENFTRLDNDEQRAVALAYPEESHPALPHFSKLARELNCWLLLGSLSIRVEPTRINNRSYLIDNMGNIVGSYNKIHLFDVNLGSGQAYRESDVVAPGDSAVLLPTPWGALGLTICYDVRFAYLYRALAQAGAKFIAVPAAFTKTTGEAHWHVLLRARAIETGCYIFAPGQGGVHECGRKTYGHSLIVNPWGEILAAAEEKPGYIMADIDLTKVEEARQRIPALSHDRHFSALQT